MCKYPRDSQSSDLRDSEGPAASLGSLFPNRKHLQLSQSGYESRCGSGCIRFDASASLPYLDVGYENVFEKLMQKFGKNCTFVVIGDGRDEESAAKKVRT